MEDPDDGWLRLLHEVTGTVPPRADVERLGIAEEGLVALNEKLDELLQLAEDTSNHWQAARSLTRWLASVLVQQATLAEVCSALADVLYPRLDYQRIALWVMRDRRDETPVDVMREATRLLLAGHKCGDVAAWTGAPIGEVRDLRSTLHLEVQAGRELSLQALDLLNEHDGRGSYKDAARHLGAPEKKTQSAWAEAKRMRAENMRGIW